MAAVEDLRGGLVGRVGGRALLLVPGRASSWTSCGSSARSRFASATHSGMLAGESQTTIERSPGGWSSACSIASIPPQDWPRKW